MWSGLLGEVAVEISGDGKIYRAYVYGPGGGQALAQQSYDGKFYWVHTDHLGSGKKLTDSSGAVVYKGEFDPHGQVVLESATGGATYLNSHKFTGYERDLASNLDYAKARTYNHNRGRFLQPDPLSLGAANLTNPQSLNRYSYVGNDPINFTDPSGLFANPKNKVPVDRGYIDGVTIYAPEYDPLDPMNWGEKGGGGIGGFVGDKDWSDGKIPTLPGQGRASGGSNGQGAPAPTKQGDPCDQKLAKIFGREGAVVATIYEPPGIAGGVYRDDERDHMASKGVFHIYTNAQGTKANVGLYAPAGWINRHAGSPRFPAGASREDEDLIYYSFEYRAGYTINFVHVGGRDAQGRLGINFNDVSAGGGIRIGTIGGPGGGGGAWETSNTNYNHTHIRIRSTKSGRPLNPRDVFCK